MGKERRLELVLGGTSVKGWPTPRMFYRPVAAGVTPAHPLSGPFLQCSSPVDSQYHCQRLSSPIVFNYPHLSESLTFISHGPTHQGFHLSFKKLGPPLLQRFTTKIPYTSKPLKGLSVGSLPLSPPFLCLFCAPASLPTQKKGDERKMCSIYQTCLSHSNLEPPTYRLAQPSPKVNRF